MPKLWSFIACWLFPNKAVVINPGTATRKILDAFTGEKQVGMSPMGFHREITLFLQNHLTATLRSCFGKFVEETVGIRSRIFVEDKKHPMWTKLSCRYLSITRASDIKRFATNVGFSIKRKQEKLLTGSVFVEKNGSTNAVDIGRRKNPVRKGQT